MGEDEFKAYIVHLILDGKVEKALEEMAKHYRTSTPKLKVGLPKKQKRRCLACYSAKDKTIYALDSDALKSPFLILHEFYHHIRTGPDSKHRGTEQYANNFARAYVEAAQLFALGLKRHNEEE